MISGMAPFEVRFIPKDTYWLASCPALDLATQGETFEQAQANLREALTLFLESCLRRGTLEQVLREAGYEPVKSVQVEKYLAGCPLPTTRQEGKSCRA